jgi:adenine/guanine phosphoribosyltransferase-like PRPP-binding protein
MTHFGGVKHRLLAVDCLKVMKEDKTFRELSKEVNLPIGVLNRYINGVVLPKQDRAEHIIELFYKIYFDDILIKKSKTRKSKFYVTSWILSNNFFLNLISYKVAKHYKANIDKVLTAAVDGVPLAINLANFVSCKAVWAKKYQEISFSGFYVSDTIIRDRPTFTPLYIPKDMLKKGEKVLIVDDVIREGTTLNSLLDICKRAKVSVVGIFSIFITRSFHKRLSKDYDTKCLKIIKD